MFKFFKEKFFSGITKFKKTLGLAENGSVSIEDLEKILVNMNFSYDLVKKIIQEVQKSENWQEKLHDYLSTILASSAHSEEKKNVILIGINGSGKTTTAIKIARQAKNNGSVLVVPGDTFRAAARDQLIDLAKKNNISYLLSAANNPASVIYDAGLEAKKNNYEKIIIDTAGRIHQNENLLNELQKTIQVSKKYLGEFDCTVYLVLDGLQGKNLFEQATLFTEKIVIDGIILTKLDAGIKPGIIFSIIAKYKIPIVYLGYGQQDTNLVPFDRDEFLKLFLE